MKKFVIDGYTFYGPYVLGKDEIPSVSGIALMCTEAGEGVKIMSIEEASNLCNDISNSDRLELWKTNARKGIVDVYVLELSVSDSERKRIFDSMVSKRESSLNCQKKVVLEDDW